MTYKEVIGSWLEPLDDLMLRDIMAENWPADTWLWTKSRGESKCRNFDLVLTSILCQPNIVWNWRSFMVSEGKHNSVKLNIYPLCNANCEITWDLQLSCNLLGCTAPLHFAKTHERRSHQVRRHLLLMEARARTESPVSWDFSLAIDFQFS
jgi:hypothetical protein